MDKSVVMDVMKMIESKFGDIKVKLGKEHTHLGMDITFMSNGNIAIRTEEYINEVIEAFGKELGTARAPTPATKRLFDLHESSPKLDKKKQNCSITK